MTKQTIKFFAECMCGKKELTEEELKEGQENGCIMCDRCYMPKTVEKVEVKNE